MNDLERGYVAGIIDGEGFFGMGKASPPSARGRWVYHSWCVIGQTDRALLEWLQQRIGGWISSGQQRAPGWRTYYQLVLRHDGLRRALEWLPGLLRVKRPQAILMREYLHVMDGRKGDRWYDYSEVRELAHKAFKFLNARGPLKTLGEFGEPLLGDNAEPSDRGDFVDGVTARLHAFKPTYKPMGTKLPCPRCGGPMYRYKGRGYPNGSGVCRQCRWQVYREEKARRSTSAQPEEISSVMT